MAPSGPSLIKSGAGRIPGRVTAGLKRGAQTARRKTSRRLARPGSIPSGKLQNHPAFVIRGDKESCFSAVVPVRGWNQCVKCVAPFETAQVFMRRPLHRRCPDQDVRPLDRRAQRFIGLFRKIVAHLAEAKDILAIQSRYGLKLSFSVDSVRAFSAIKSRITAWTSFVLATCSSSYSPSRVCSVFIS